jgi:hypothetical protein
MPLLIHLTNPQGLPIPQVQYNCRHGRQFDEIYDQRATRDVDGILGKHKDSICATVHNCASSKSLKTKSGIS